MMLPQVRQGPGGGIRMNWWGLDGSIASPSSAPQGVACGGLLSCNVWNTDLGSGGGLWSSTHVAHVNG